MKKRYKIIILILIILLIILSFFIYYKGSEQKKINECLERSKNQCDKDCCMKESPNERAECLQRCYFLDPV